MRHEGVSCVCSVSCSARGPCHALFYPEQASVTPCFVTYQEDRRQCGGVGGAIDGALISLPASYRRHRRHLSKSSLNRRCLVPKDCCLTGWDVRADVYWRAIGCRRCLQWPRSQAVTGICTSRSGSERLQRGPPDAPITSASPGVGPRPGATPEPSPGPESVLNMTQSVPITTGERRWAAEAYARALATEPEITDYGFGLPEGIDNAWAGGLTDEDLDQIARAPAAGCKA